MATVRRRRWAKVLLAVGVVLAVAIVAYVLNVIVTALTCDQSYCRPSVSSLVGYAAGVLTAVWAVWLSVVEVRKLRAEDRQREVAAHGVVAALSVERELGGVAPATLAIPMTLRLRLAWRTVQTSIIFCVVFVAIEFAYVCTLFTQSTRHPVTIAYAVGVQGMAIGFLVLTFGGVWFAASERLIATEGGLSVCRLGVTRRIRWADARLFAFIGPNAFELSGPHSIVRWTCPTDTSFYDTVIPLEEYQARMGELLLLIADRTGLPLADLVEPAR